MDTKQILVFLLETERQQLLRAHRLQGWLIALVETMQARDPGFREALKAHRLYRLPDEPINDTDALISKIDAIINSLEDRRHDKVRPISGV